MEKRPLQALKMLGVIATLIMVSVTSLMAAYNSECWVVSNGEDIYKLNANGLADPTVIPGLTQAQAAVVNPKDGSVWIAVSAANTVFKFDPATQAFTQIPDINQPHSISVNPKEDTVWIGGRESVHKVNADGSPAIPPITGVYEPVVSVNTTDGSCWVTDSRGKVHRYGTDGSLMVTAAVEITEPKYVAVNSKTGEAWVTDPQANAVYKISPSGQVLFKSVDEIQLPTSPSVNQQDGSVWLVSGPFSLIKLAPNGQKAMEISDAGVSILSISVDSKDGSIWVADQLGETFQGEVSKFSAAGQKLFKNDIPMPSFVSVGYWAEQ